MFCVQGDYESYLIELKRARRRSVVLFGHCARGNPYLGQYVARAYAQKPRHWINADAPIRQL